MAHRHVVPRTWHVLLTIPLMALSLAVVANPHQGPADGPARTLGVGVSNLSPEALGTRGLEHGVLVETVAPGSPAAAAGLQAQDIIVEMAGKPVYSGERLQWLVREAPAGEAIALAFRRGESLQTGSVAFPPAATDRAGPAAGDVSGGWPVLGLRFQPMTPDLRSAFGSPEDLGVLVVDVVDGSAAATAGIAAGDIIVRIDRRSIHSSRDVHRALGFFDPGETVEVEVIRDRARRVLTARLGAPEPQMLGHSCPEHGGGGHPMMPHGWSHPWRGHN
jgi:S1-C subfamily serine protease